MIDMYCKVRREESVQHPITCVGSGYDMGSFCIPLNFFEEADRRADRLRQLMSCPSLALSPHHPLALSGPTGHSL
jgi:hypothetical protein